MNIQKPHGIHYMDYVHTTIALSFVTQTEVRTMGNEPVIQLLSSPYIREYGPRTLQKRHCPVNR